jgi:hypothetical protein
VSGRIETDAARRRPGSPTEITQQRKVGRLDVPVFGKADTLLHLVNRLLVRPLDFNEGAEKG